MLRIIRRAPWIAVGALGAWFFDPQQGPERRARFTQSARDTAARLTGTGDAQSAIDDRVATPGAPVDPVVSAPRDASAIAS